MTSTGSNGSGSGSSTSGSLLRPTSPGPAANGSTSSPPSALGPSPRLNGSPSPRFHHHHHHSPQKAMLELVCVVAGKPSLSPPFSISAFPELPVSTFRELIGSRLEQSLKSRNLKSADLDIFRIDHGPILRDNHKLQALAASGHSFTPSEVKERLPVTLITYNPNALLSEFFDVGRTFSSASSAVASPASADDPTTESIVIDVIVTVRRNAYVDSGLGGRSKSPSNRTRASLPVSANSNGAAQMARANLPRVKTDAVSTEKGQTSPPTQSPISPVSPSGVSLQQQRALRLQQRHSTTSLSRLGRPMSFIEEVDEDLRRKASVESPTHSVPAFVASHILARSHSADNFKPTVASDSDLSEEGDPQGPISPVRVPSRPSSPAFEDDASAGSARSFPKPRKVRSFLFGNSLEKLAAQAEVMKQEYEIQKEAEKNGLPSPGLMIDDTKRRSAASATDSEKKRSLSNVEFAETLRGDSPSFSRSDSLPRGPSPLQNLERGEFLTIASSTTSAHDAEMGAEDEGGDKPAAKLSSIKDRVLPIDPIVAKMRRRRRNCWIILSVITLVLIGLGLALYFVWPRVPSASFVSWQEDVANPQVNIGPDINNGFILQVNADMSFDIYSPNFVDLNTRSIAATFWILDATGGKLKNGQFTGIVRGVTLAKRKSTRVILPSYVTYTQSSPVSVTVADLTSFENIVGLLCTLVSPNMSNMTMAYDLKFAFPLYQWAGYNPVVSGKLVVPCQ